MIRSAVGGRPIEDPRLTLSVWLLLLGLLTLAVRSGLLAGADVQLAEWLGAVRAPIWDQLAQAITFFGSSAWTAFAVAVMAVWWWRRGQRATLIAFGTSALAGLAFQVFLRLAVVQWRPDSSFPGGPLSLIDRVELAGFTSGHAFRSAYLFGWWADALLARRSRWARAGAIACAACIVLVGLTRLYLRRHWLTDVFGGWIVAIVALALAKWWLRARR